MKYNVTVDQAIARGKRLCVILPGVLLFCFMMGSPFVYAVTKDAWFIIAGIVLAFLLSWFSWAVFVVRWRIWAYTNVRNVHELKKRAIEEKIMTKEGSFFSKTEIKTPQQRYLLQQLEARFKERDVFTDDADVPSETYIYFSRNKIYAAIIAGTIVFAFGNYLLFTIETVKDGVFSFIMIGVGVFMIGQDIKKLRSYKPVMVLSDEGIRLQGKALSPWDDIYNEMVMAKNYGQERIYVLEYHHSGGHESIELRSFKIKKDRLRHLLRVYRCRHEENKKLEM